ncbi:MAG: hypothetical protein QMC36_09155 [Patescibacteria group bacterium]
MSGQIKKSVLSATAFFLTLVSLSGAYAALSAGLTTSDLKSAGNQVSVASWNRMVNSILELDARTSAPVVTKINGTFGSYTTNIPNNTWTYIGDTITLTPGNWIVYYDTFYDTDGITSFSAASYNHPFLSTTTSSADAVSKGGLTSCALSYCPVKQMYEVSVPVTTTYKILHLVNSYGGSYVRIR